MIKGHREETVMSDKMSSAEEIKETVEAPEKVEEEKPAAKTAFEPGDVDTMLGILDKRMNRLLTSSLAACVHCGLCTEACHVYASKTQKCP